MGDPVLISRKPTGTLVLRDLKPGKRLFMFTTSTGLAPFMSLIHEPETYERFEKVILIPRRSLDERTRLPRLHRAGFARRVPRRHDPRATHLLPDRDARAVPQRGPPDGADHVRQAVRGSRYRTARPGNRPRHDLQQPGHAQGNFAMLDGFGFEISHRIGEMGGVIERAFVEQ